MTITPSTSLRIRVSGFDLASLSISARDASGNEHAGLLDSRRLWDWMVQGFDAHVLRVGPVPHGFYRVRVWDAEGNEASINVEVDKGEMPIVDLPAETH